MNRDGNYIIIIIISVFSIILMTIFSLIDMKNGSIESVTLVYLSFVNIVVTSILSYSLILATKKTNEINTQLTELSIHQFNESKKKETMAYIVSIEKYIRNLNVIILMLLPSLGIIKKLEILEKIKRNKTYIEEFLFIYDPLILENLPKRSEILQYNMMPDLDKNEGFHKVDTIFKNSLPNSVHAFYRVKDAEEHWEQYINIYNDEILQLSSLERTQIIDSQDTIKGLMEKILNSNQEDVKYIDCKINHFDANLAYDILKLHSKSLKNMQRELLIELEKIKEQSINEK